MSLRFAVVYEAHLDYQVATELADRVLLTEADWLEEWIEDARKWVSTDNLSRPLKWSAIGTLAREKGIRAHGKFDNRSGEPDAKAARRAIRYVKDEFPEINAILLIRDQDDQPNRRLGLEQALSESHVSLPVVIGFSVVEIEAWIICGFEPENERETAQCESERKRLGFDPCEQSHRLLACKNDQAVRSAKRVLCSLTKDDRERASRCWSQTPLATLRRRGQENGLGRFLDDVQVVLAPMLAANRRSR